MFQLYLANRKAGSGSSTRRNCRDRSFPYHHSYLFIKHDAATQAWLATEFGLLEGSGSDFFRADQTFWIGAYSDGGCLNAGINSPADSCFLFRHQILPKSNVDERQALLKLVRGAQHYIENWNQRIAYPLPHQTARGERSSDKNSNTFSFSLADWAGFKVPAVYHKARYLNSRRNLVREMGNGSHPGAALRFRADKFGKVDKF